MRATNSHRSVLRSGPEQTRLAFALMVPRPENQGPCRGLTVGGRFYSQLRGSPADAMFRAQRL